MVLEDLEACGARKWAPHFDASVLAILAFEYWLGVTRCLVNLHVPVLAPLRGA